MGFLKSYTEGDIKLNSSVKTKKNNMGLLQKSLLLSEKKVFIKDLIFNFNLDKFLILQKDNNKYFVKTSCGLDGESIICAQSTQDFWNGIITEKEKLYTFENENLSPFYQLFSFSLKDKIENLSLFQINSECIFIAINNKKLDLDNLYKFVQNLDFNNNTCINENHTGKYENLLIDYTKAIDEFLDSKKINERKDIYKKALISEIFNENLHYFTDIRNDEALFYVTCEKSDSFDFQLLSVHIKSLFNNVIPSKKIEITDKGTSESIREIKLFLQAE